MAAYPKETGFWSRFDHSAFGIVYGAIMVLAILMAMGEHPGAPFETAAVLFGSVLAITLAKAFAEFLGGALGSGQRMERATWRSAWQHSYPTLTVANVPTLLFCGAGLGWIDADFALIAAQVFAVALLTLIGARAGWVLDRTVISTVLGAAFAAGVGLALAVLKVLIHKRSRQVATEPVLPSIIQPSITAFGACQGKSVPNGTCAQRL
ncbi:hypothetical protein [Aliiruegeria lutimaris]|uniref:Uncharacterized protein n=1 Tax=Aliiruegeria lutimaris TaxID=571298 RepID=A0A1G8PH83_9RHOB|nr:hypothetical protein [Aliiruegeria lutimaris]SDI91841.1 hypothetical protein SAMN04488026_10092 [Aliiruegeria lutimaris]